MANSTESKNITIDLDLILTPLAIILSAIMVSASILYTFGGSSLKKTTSTTVSASSIEALVEEVGVDLDDYKECIANNNYDQEIKKDISDGQSAGITGTPGFVVGVINSDGQVDGTLISGAQPFSVFKAEIDKHLNGNGDKSAKVNIDDDPLIGDKNKAKVAIVEFSDFECPFCQRFHNDTYDQLVEEYVDSGKAVYVYRDFPLSFHEPKASEAAVAANCVKEVSDAEKYFAFSKLYYANTNSNGQGL